MRYTLAFPLQLRKKHGQTSVGVVGECQLAQRMPECQSDSGFPSQYQFISSPHLHPHVSVTRRTNGRSCKPFKRQSLRKKSTLVLNSKEPFFFPIFRKFYTSPYRKHVNWFGFPFLIQENTVD